ncbi:MAG: FAD-dependent oxidoreductase [Candidatus Omnitrophota bacterium]|jgi:NADPH-dependent 2,4-dienoyl-CoA reductase/sulfur reductase-like enzyme/rhodanese-related sulfurtransferase
MKIVIIGGVAAGPKAASKIMRMNSEADVTIIEKGELLSYAGCGLPYYISGEVKEQKQLMETPAGAVRDAVFFQNVKNLKVLTSTEVVEIDRAGKRVRAKTLAAGKDFWLSYDKLILATGALPVIPPIPGVNKKNVFTLHGVHDAEGIKQALAEERAKDVVIIGGGLIGVEVTEALTGRGCRVTIVEMLPQILNLLDWEMARLVEQHMESKGVKIMTNTKALALESSHEADNTVAQVRTDKGTVPADMVILAIGVRPNISLAQQAGLTIGEKTKAIRVNDYMQTSDPDIYAAGDCVECKDRLTGQTCFIPLGSTANKQGRVAAVNICGGTDTFPGVLGSAVCKVFDFCAARTGLTEKAARSLGYDVVTAMAPGPDKAHYMPKSKALLLKIVADKKTGKLLGAQATGPGDGAKRIDVAATAIAAGMTLEDVANLDLAYAPPYAPAMDNLITAANVARNKRDGFMVGITAEEVHRKFLAKDDFFFLDVRSPKEYVEVRLPQATLIPLGVIRKRLGEIPRDKEIIAFCKVSLRGYEAALILKAAGFSNVKVLDGGIAMWPYEKEC